MRERLSLTARAACVFRVENQVGPDDQLPIHLVKINKSIRAGEFISPASNET